MSITTFAELSTAVTNWIDRTDLSSRIPEFITLWEAEVNRRLRLRQQTASTSLTPSAGSATLPTDYLEWKRVTWTGTPKRELDYVTPSFLQAFNPSAISATPLYFTIEGETLKIAYLSTTALDFLYAQKVPALTASATTNWLLTAHPDVYLYGTLSRAATFTSDADNGRAWLALADQALEQMWRLNFSQTGTLVQRTYGPTP